MKTINLYKFSELSDENKKKAIISYREALNEGKFGSQDFFHWAIDDCALFEPPHEEMVKLFGENYYQDNGEKFLLANNRKVTEYEYPHVLKCSDAIEINDSGKFLKWLGLEGYENAGFEISEGRYRTTIKFYDPLDDTLKHEDIFYRAINKFDDHIDVVGKRINDSIESRYSDEGITEDLEANDLEIFTEEGKILLV